MSSIVISPLLAAGLEGFGVIIFIVIAIISWLVNLANQKNQPPQPPPRQPRRQGSDKLSQEIDKFLQEVSGKRKPAEPVELEVVPENEIRQRRVQRPVPQQPVRRGVSKSQSKKPVATLQRQRPGQEMAERKNIDPSRLGTTLQSHLSTYMDADRLGNEVEQRLKHDVEKSVDEHLGRFGGGRNVDAPVATAATRLPQNAGEVVNLLRNPAGVRQAILLNEVLSKPLGLRKR